MRGIGTLLLLGLLAGSVPALSAGRQTPPGAKGEVLTLNLRDTPLHDAIAALFKLARVRYEIAPEVPNVPVSLTVREMPFKTAVRTLVLVALRQVPDLTYAERDGVYDFRLRKTRRRSPTRPGGL